MAGISGVGSGSSVIYPLATSSNADGADPLSADASSGAPAASQDNGANGSTAATSPLADLRGQIETAVKSAVDQLPAGSSPKDIFSAIQGAVQSTLQANGLDPQQILGQGHRHHHHHAHGAGGGGAAAGGDEGGGDDQQNTNPLTAPGSTSADALVTLLQQITGSGDSQTSNTGEQSSTSGGDQTDPLLSALQNSASGSAGQTNSLLSALQNSASGGVNIQNIFLQLFQNFPSGTGLDVRA